MVSLSLRIKHVSLRRSSSEGRDQRLPCRRVYAPRRVQYTANTRESERRSTEHDLNIFWTLYESRLSYNRCGCNPDHLNIAIEEERAHLPEAFVEDKPFDYTVYILLD